MAGLPQDGLGGFQVVFGSGLPVSPGLISGPDIVTFGVPWSLVGGSGVTGGLPGADMAAGRPLIMLPPSWLVTQRESSARARRSCTGASSTLMYATLPLPPAVRAYSCGAAMSLSGAGTIADSLGWEPGKSSLLPGATG